MTFANQDPQQPVSEPIAIIGIGCRLPGGANSPTAFWQLLCDEVDAITEIPADRWSIQKFFDPDPSKPGQTHIKWGGFIDDFDRFDANFFGISPREAAVMDPQQRVLLETTWEALEDGGQAPERLTGSATGVFVGVFMRDWEQLHCDALNRPLINNHTGTGSAMSIAANRISYLFDFHGPSIALDTACSSSLIAVHLACQSLHNGECTLAVAGGVSLLFSPEKTIATSKATMLSPDGRCKSFDARANGYVRSEGCGMVVLKPLSKAVADGDPIYAIIRGSATNQDGRSQGLTVPNGQAQEAAFHAALRQSGYPAGAIQYIEAHGTGTYVGDPIEANALGIAVGRQRTTPCLIGSVKSNIGHLEAAAGVAGLIKTALVLKHGQIPANLHFETPNPQIQFDFLNLKVPTTLTPWPQTDDGPRLAAVNSFGFGGTNATVILEEAPPQPTHSPLRQSTDLSAQWRDAPVKHLPNGERRPQSDGGTPPRREHPTRPLLFPISARTPQALRAAVQAQREFVSQTPHALTDLCYSAAQRRGHHPERAAFVAATTDALMVEMDAFLADEQRLSIAVGQVSDRPVQLAFVYAGMGSQWPGMGRQLWTAEPLFQQALQEVDRHFTQLAGWSVVRALLADDAETEIHQTAVAQPAIFAIQVGLTALWRSWGVEPTAIVGHSVGEIAAAHAAGALTLADAVRVIYHRSRLQQTTAGQGTMLAVALSADEISSYLTPYTDVVSIGAINSPTSVTLAGDADALSTIAQQLEMAHIFNRFLNVEVPYHSPQMEPLRTELLASLAELQPKTVTIPLYSTVSGKLIDGTTLDATYWWRNIRRPVRFTQAIAQMQLAGATHFLEVGPHPVLGRSIQETLQQVDQEETIGLRVLPSLRRAQPEQTMLLKTFGQLYTQGYPIPWERLMTGEFVRLPTYPWQRERYWLESAASMRDRLGDPADRASADQHPLLGKRLNLALAAQVWENQLSYSRLPYLREHRVQQMVIFPGAGYVEMALAVAAQHGAPPRLNEIEFSRALPLFNGDPLNQPPPASEPEMTTHLQLTLSGDTINILSQRTATTAVDDRAETEVAWIRHAGSRLASQQNAGSAASQPLNISALQERLVGLLTKNAIYEQFEALGLAYGPTFQGISQLWYKDDEVLTKLHLQPDVVRTASNYQVHPVLIDLCLQSFLGVLTTHPVESGSDGVPAARMMYLPVRIDQLTLLRRPDLHEPLYCHAWLTDGELNGAAGEQIAGNIRLFTPNGELLLIIEGLRCQALAARNERTQAAHHNGHATYEIRWQPATSVAEEQNRWTADDPHNWLIFADRQGVAEKLAQELTARGQRPILVWPGERFTREGPEQVSMRPGNAMDMAALFTGLTGQTVHGVVHLWNLESSGASPLDQDIGTISILHLVQSLAQPLPRLWLVTQGARRVQDVGLGQMNQVQQAAAWGLGRVIVQEHPGLQAVCVDVDPNAPAEEAARQLFYELDPKKGAAQQIEDQVAWRANERHVARLVVAPLDPTAHLMADRMLCANASYLITGGMGALGMQVAQSLVEQGARHLVLCSRRGSVGKEAALTALRAQGAQVLVLQADVSRHDDVIHLLQTIASAGPPLRGVIHAAGLLDDGVLRQQSAERFAKVFQPKVAGAWHLHEQTRALDLDFFVSFSSVASLLGSPGQGNYAAANAYLDALAVHRRVLGLPAQAINWGPWAESGMAAEQQIQDHLAALGVGSFTPADGIALFQNLLSAATEHAPQIGAVLIDWPTFYAKFPSAQLPFLSLLTQGLTAQQEQLLDTLVELPQSEWRERVGDFLRAQLAQVLGFAGPEKISRRQRLVDLGLDSVMVVELQNRLERGLNVELATALIFEYQTVDALLDYLMRQITQTSDTLPQQAEITWGEMETEVEIAAGSEDEDALTEKTEQLLARLDSLSAEELTLLLNEAFEAEPNQGDTNGDVTNEADAFTTHQMKERVATATAEQNEVTPRFPHPTETGHGADANHTAQRAHFDEASLRPPHIMAIFEQVYRDFSGRELPMDQQVTHRVPLDADPVTAEGRKYQQRYGIPSGAAIHSFRHVNAALPQVRHVYARYIGGVHAGLDTQDPGQMWQRVQRVEDEFRDFAVEGVGTAYAILDAVRPGDRLARWIQGPASAYLGTINIGVGIALSMLKRPVEPYIAELDSILRWKIVDGYGFTYGMFDWQTGVEKQHFPDDLSEEARHIYYQGLGRSLWFACCGESQDIAGTIARFPQIYQGDMWSGAAFGSTMAGGVTGDDLEQLRTLGQDHLPAIAQGSAFAVHMRGSAGALLPRQELACQVYWQRPAHDVAAIAQETYLVAADSDKQARSSAYQEWRTHIQRIFVTRESNWDGINVKSTG